MKLKHLLAMAGVAAVGSSAWAQSVGDVLTVGGTKYEVKGANLFTNGSFDDGVNGWKATNYTTAAVASNFTITETGGVNDGAYITTNAAGAGDAKSIRQSIAVENGKMYYFSVYTSGKAPASNNYNFNALFKMTDASTENGVLKAFEWPQGAEKTTSEWNKTESVFTASTSHVGVRMSWNSSTKFDEFVLCEIDYYFDKQILTDEITTAQAQLATYTSGTKWYNSLNSAIQTAQAADPKDAAALNAAVQALKDAEADAAAEYADDQVVQAHAAEVSAYNTAMADMQKIEGLTWSAAPGTAGQHWNGTNDKYYDTWDKNGTTKTYTATITLPAGTYKFRAAGRGQVGTTTFIQVGDGEQTTFNNAGDTGYGIETDGTMNYSMHGTYANNNAGRGWEWRIIEFTLPSEQEVTLKCGYTVLAGTWASVCQPELFTAASNFAGQAVFDALNAAITTAEAHTLGFGVGEYAPYNNIAALNLIKAAKEIDPEKNYFVATVNAAKEALEGATWTANTEEMNAVYNGTFENSTPNATSGVDVDMPGWTPVAGIRMVVGDATVDAALNEATAHKAFFMWGNTSAIYGEQDGYTMPLKEGVYELTFKIAGWRDGDLPTSISAGLNDCTNIGDLVKPTKRINAENGFTVNTIKIVVPTDGNYKLTLYSSKHASFTDISLLRVPETEIAGTTVTAANGWGTFISEIDRDIPTGMKAYSCAGVESNGQTLTLVEATEGIKANTPYILENTTSEDITIDAENGQSLATKDAYTVGLLTGVYTATPAEDGWYVLQNNAAGVGFYQVDTNEATPTVGANRAYLTAPAGGSANVRAFRLDNNANAIEAISAIANNAIEAIYNANGVKVNALQKGINVVKMQNGMTQKVLVK